MESNAKFIRQITVGPLKASCYIFGDPRERKAIIIDPGGSPAEIRSLLGEYRFMPECVVNTHGHIDHIAANNAFGLPVWIHSDDAQFLTDNELNLSNSCGISYRGKPPDRLLNDGDTIKVGGLLLEVVHTPGHTPGGICLRCQGALFTGDTLFAGGIGRCDFPYGSEETLLRSIREKLLTLDKDVKIYPGHGGQSTIGRELRSSAFLGSF